MICIKCVIKMTITEIHSNVFGIKRFQSSKSTQAKKGNHRICCNKFFLSTDLCFYFLGMNHNVSNRIKIEPAIRIDTDASDILLFDILLAHLTSFDVL